MAISSGPSITGLLSWFTPVFLVVQSVTCLPLFSLKLSSDAFGRSRFPDPSTTFQDLGTEKENKGQIILFKGRDQEFSPITSACDPLGWTALSPGVPQVGCFLRYRNPEIPTSRDTAQTRKTQDNSSPYRGILPPNVRRGDFPGNPVVRTLHFQSRGCGFDP